MKPLPQLGPSSDPLRDDWEDGAERRGRSIWGSTEAGLLWVARVGASSRSGSSIRAGNTGGSGGGSHYSQYWLEVTVVVLTKWWWP